MTDIEINFVILQKATLEFLSHGVVLPGSTVITANCGHLCLISRTGRDFWYRDPRGLASYSWCTECATQDTHADTEERVMMPKAAEEIAAVFGIGVADQVLAAARDAGVQMTRPLEEK